MPIEAIEERYHGASLQNVCYGSQQDKKLASESKSIILLNSYVTKYTQLKCFPWQDFLSKGS